MWHCGCGRIFKKLWSRRKSFEISRRLWMKYTMAVQCTYQCTYLHLWWSCLVLCWIKVKVNTSIPSGSLSRSSGCFCLTCLWFSVISNLASILSTLTTQDHVNLFKERLPLVARPSQSQSYARQRAEMFQLNTKDDIAESVQRDLPGQEGTPDIGQAAFDMWEAIAQK